MVRILKPTKMERMDIKSMIKKLPQRGRASFSIFTSGKKFLLVETGSEGRPIKERFLIARSKTRRGINGEKRKLFKQLRFSF